MKKLTIIQRDINTTGGYQPFVSNPTTPPFVAPLDNHYLSITYVAYAEWCGDNSSRNVKVSGVVGVTPIHWALTLGEQLAVTLPTSWEAEGFETGPVLIFVAQSATDRIILEADIIDISGTTATIIPSSIIQQSGNPAIENEEDSICFLQDLTPKYPPAAMLVRDGEEGTFYSSLNPNASAFGANPDTAWRQTWNNNGTYYYPTLPYWAQQWGVSYWPDIEVYNAIFSVGHFWPLQDGYDLQGTQNQDAYFGNTLRLLFGIKPNFYTHFPIRTAHVNCTESGAFTGGDVVLGGTQGAWTITTTPPTGATLLAEYLAVFNDEAANQGASQNTVQLLQTTQNTGTVFNVVAPNPQVVAVAVFQMPSGEYGVRVSNAISILPPPSPLVVISPAENTLQYAIGKLERLRPWDAIAFRVSADPSLLPPLAQHPYIRARWWAFVRNVGTGTTWMLEDAEFEYPSIILTPTLEGDATLLYQYVARLHTQLPAPSEADIFINLSQPLAEHHMRTYAAVYLTQQLAPGVSLAPTGTLPPQLEVCGGLLLETPSGVHYAECTFTVEINPYTTDGVWLNDYTWQSPPSPPVPPGRTLEVYWRLAQFPGTDISKNPVWQEDDQHITMNTPIAAIVGPHPGGLVFTRMFPSPPAQGEYIHFVRFGFIEYDGISTLYNIGTQYAEVRPFKVKRQLEVLNGRSVCPPCVPATEADTLYLLYPQQPSGITTTPAGDWFQYTGPPLCDIPAPHCGYTIVDDIPPEWVDVVAHYDNYILDDVVIGTQLVRVPGVLRRVDDEVNEERYVTGDQKELSIVRAFRRRYELEAFISSPCLLWQVELLRFAKRIDQIIVRRGLLINDRDLVVEDFRVRDLGEAYVVTITMREEQWRHELRIK